MKTTQANFTAMKGHVDHGQEVMMDNGQTWRILNELAGWKVICGCQVIAKNMRSAFEVECFIVNSHAGKF